MKVDFQPVDEPQEDVPDVADLSAAMLAAPGKWFALTGIMFGHDDATQEKLSAVREALARSFPGKKGLKYQAPRGRGYAQVSYQP